MGSAAGCRVSCLRRGHVGEEREEEGRLARELALQRRQLRAVRRLGARARLGVGEHAAEGEAKLEDLVERRGDRAHLPRMARVAAGDAISGLGGMMGEGRRRQPAGLFVQPADAECGYGHGGGPPPAGSTGRAARRGTPRAPPPDPRSPPARAGGVGPRGVDLCGQSDESEPEFDPPPSQPAFSSATRVSCSHCTSSTSTCR